MPATQKYKRAILACLVAVPIGFLGWGYTQLVLDEARMPSRDIGYRLRVAYGFDGQFFLQRDAAVILPRSHEDRMEGIAIATVPDASDWLIVRTNHGWHASKLALAGETQGVDIPVISFVTKDECAAYLRNAGVMAIPDLESPRSFVRSGPPSR